MTLFVNETALFAVGDGFSLLINPYFIMILLLFYYCYCVILLL
jgi:hypothetical protein